jgi:hypothetical protein
MSDEMKTDQSAELQEQVYQVDEEEPTGVAESAARAIAGLPVTAPQFVLILQDNGDKIEMAGVQKPAEFDPNSAAHIVGRWLGENMALVIQMAKGSFGAAASLQQESARLEDGEGEAEDVIGPDRERTIVMPGVSVGRGGALNGG